MQNARLCKALERLVDKWGPLEGQTRVANLVYLSDRAWFHRHGRTYTEAKYSRANNGPLAPEIFAALSWMDGIEIVEVEIQTRHGPDYSYESGGRTRLRQVVLDDEFVCLLDQTAARWKDKPSSSLHDHVYAADDFRSAGLGDSLLVARAVA